MCANLTIPKTNLTFSSVVTQYHVWKSNLTASLYRSINPQYTTDGDHVGLVWLMDQYQTPVQGYVGRTSENVSTAEALILYTPISTARKFLFSKWIWRRSGTKYLFEEFLVLMLFPGGHSHIMSHRYVPLWRPPFSVFSSRSHDMRFYLTAPRFASDSLPRYTKNNAHSPLPGTARTLALASVILPLRHSLFTSGKLAQLPSAQPPKLNFRRPDPAPSDSLLPASPMAMRLLPCLSLTITALHCQV